MNIWLRSREGENELWWGEKQLRHCSWMVGTNASMWTAWFLTHNNVMRYWCAPSQYIFSHEYEIFANFSSAIIVMLIKLFDVGPCLSKTKVPWIVNI